MDLRMTWGVHADLQSVVDDFIPLSNSIKYCVANFNDSDRIKTARALAHPSTNFICRATEMDQEGNPLHNSFWALAADDFSGGYTVGSEYAGWLADRIIPNGLDFMLCESGPNEGAKAYDPKTLGHMMGFFDRGRARGLRVLLGGFSYGTPRLPEFNSGVDDWAGWDPIFHKIDEANRKAYAVGAPDFVAGLYVHEGFRFPENPYPNFEESVPYTIGRLEVMYARHITPYGLFVPWGSTEFAYGNDYNRDAPKPPTEVMMQQVAKVLRKYALDPLCYGLDWYDWRNVSLRTYDDYSGQRGDFKRMLTDLIDPVDPTQDRFVFTRIPRPTSTPVPSPDTIVEVGIKDPTTNYLNVRSGPGWLYSKINKFYPDDRMILSGEALANVANVEGCWVYCDGTLADANKRGWVAGWLLERKPY